MERSLHLQQDLLVLLMSLGLDLLGELDDGFELGVMLLLGPFLFDLWLASAQFDEQSR